MGWFGRLGFELETLILMGWTSGLGHELEILIWNVMVSLCQESSLVVFSAQMILMYSGLVVGLWPCSVSFSVFGSFPIICLF